jgi:hypothetical protein
MIRVLLFCFFFSGSWHNCFAQVDLLALAMDSSNGREKALAAFQGNRIISGQSVQTVGKNNLDFLISHRFDRLNRGVYDFFGLDGALIRLGLDYGLTDHLTVGLGRSNYFKTYDIYGKYRVLQQTADNYLPFTATAFFSLNVRTQDVFGAKQLVGADRLTYTTQLLLARRFSPNFSFQLSPTYIYRVRPELAMDPQGVFALGLGGRVRLTKRISLTGEYYSVFPDQINPVYANSLMLGFDIDTGGHVFQLHFTNSYGMTERYFITETTDSWARGDIHFGFNISRTFSLGKKLK